MSEKIDFNKPALSIEHQIVLLTRRGLSIKDKIYATQMLRFIGYYHFSAYALAFQTGDKTENHHRFIDGTEFEAIVDLYNFDRSLRLIIMDAIERIEIALRAMIINEMSVPYGPHWYMEQAYFEKRFFHDDFIKKVQGDIGYDKDPSQMRDICIKHYYETYKSPAMPPIWMVFESLSLATISLVFKNLNHSDKKRIAGSLDIPVAVLGSWLHTISYTRNLCAHHQRVWNRVFTIKPLVPTDPKLRYLKDDLTPNTKFYAQAIVLIVLMNKIYPQAKWSENLKKHISSQDDDVLHKMGFPHLWLEHEIWN